MNLSRPCLMATAIVALAAWSKKPPQELPPALGGDASAQTCGPATPSGLVKGSQEDFVASVLSDRILFDTDQYDVDAQDQQILQSQAAWLQQNPNVRVTIEGHADERGTRDYNIALGERRANRSEEHTSELQSLMRISFAVFWLKKKKQCTQNKYQQIAASKLESTK